MIAIFGSSGHAREIAFIARSQGIAISFFVDSNGSNNKIGDIEIISEERFFDLTTVEQGPISVYIAIGEATIRKKIVEKLRSNGTDAIYPNLFHPSVIKDDNSNAIKLGEGNIFFPGVILTTNIEIGNHNHFNVYSSISHDATIGSYNTFSPGVTIAGKVSIGDFNFFGTKATIINNIKIHDKIIIGAGATVVRSIDVPGTYIGVPAKKIK